MKAFAMSSGSSSNALITCWQAVAPTPMVQGTESRGERLYEHNLPRPTGSVGGSPTPKGFPTKGNRRLTGLRKRLTS